MRWILAAAAAAAILLIGAPRHASHVNGGRGVRLSPRPVAPEPRTFDPGQSAALFVGVRRFTRDDDIAEVPFAADDAVDLAYTFALDRRVALVSPLRVVVALSGRPQKEESKIRLDELTTAGAKIAKAEQADILKLLQRQAALTGRDGMLIVSIATHGFVRNGVPLILGADSLFQYPETALPAPKLFDIASTSEGRRSLFLIDACRERISENVRGNRSPVTAAPLISRMGRVAGQVVLYAAAAGGYAYDDDGNGVFTKAILDGLSCKAAFARGAVTVETLRTFVERSVRGWIRQHRDPHVGAATQVSMEGDSKNMPLAVCAGPPPPPPPGDVARASHDGRTVTAFAADGTRLWSRDAGDRVSRVEVADLDDEDGSHNVIAATSSSIQVFDRGGATLWSAGERMKLRTFLIGHLLRHDLTLQITALWSDASRSLIAAYSANGQRLFAYSDRRSLQLMAIDRPTSRHKRRIIAAGARHIVLLDSNGKLRWQGVVTEHIARLEIVNRDQHWRDIEIVTASGEKMRLDFEGKVVQRSSPRLSFKLLRNVRRTLRR